MWRYREAIPVNNDSNIVSFDEGFTPLTRLNIQGRPVLIKQEQLSPTGSFKDRGAAVLISKIKELNISEVVEDSSGNAGAAISAYCTAAGIECSIYVPESTSKAKLVQIIVNGAKLNRVKGTREDTANAVLKSAEKIYYASHVYNPFFFQGTKTIAYEICEQLDWVSPDTVILPVGHGSLLLGMHTGFSELLYAGLIKKMPKLIAVQSENCSPLYRTFKSNLKKIHSIEKKRDSCRGNSYRQSGKGDTDN